MCDIKITQTDSRHETLRPNIRLAPGRAVTVSQLLHKNSNLRYLQKLHDQLRMFAACQGSRQILPEARLSVLISAICP